MRMYMYVHAYVRAYMYGQCSKCGCWPCYPAGPAALLCCAVLLCSPAVLGTGSVLHIPFSFFEATGGCTDANGRSLCLPVGRYLLAHAPAPAHAPEEDNPFADHHTSGYSAPPGPPPLRTEPERPLNGLGYQPTPSYLGRQESSANNLTMHGGVAQPNSTNDERPRTPERIGHRHNGSDVSPVTERGPVTYRY